MEETSHSCANEGEKRKSKVKNGRSIIRFLKIY
jgi:hypothetical protein